MLPFCVLDGLGMRVFKSNNDGCHVARIKFSCRPRRMHAYSWNRKGLIEDLVEESCKHAHLQSEYVLEKLLEYVFPGFMEVAAAPTEVLVATMGGTALYNWGTHP